MYAANMKDNMAPSPSKQQTRTDYKTFVSASWFQLSCSLPSTFTVDLTGAVNKLFDVSVGLQAG